MTINDRVKEKNYQTIWTIKEFYPNGYYLLEHTTYTGLLCAKTISAHELYANYTKVDDEETEDQLDWFGNFGDYLPAGSQEDLKQSQCFHLWKLYIGFNECYEYCTKCDLKKEVEEN